MPVNYLNKDPFPQISPALLNSADIEDYVNKTSMVTPFDPQKLKPSSYEVGFEGVLYLWDEDGEPHKIDLDNEKTFTLPKNSIAFLFTKTKFSLPYYIALRFNLKITHVHRGILLGTGPLIDPGFEGNLLIPVHNLTTNDYVFNVGEGLIWVEFTKLSENESWVKIDKESERIGKYREFPRDKKNKNAEYYFGKAAMGKAIRSSIPAAMRQTAEDAKKAKKEAEKATASAKEAEKSTKKLTFRGTVGIVVVIIGLFISLYIGFGPVLQIVNESVNYVKDEQKFYNEKGSEILDEIINLKIQIDNLNKRIDNKIESEKVNYEEFDKRITEIEHKNEGIYDIEKNTKSESTKKIQ